MINNIKCSSVRDGKTHIISVTNVNKETTELMLNRADLKEILAYCVKQFGPNQTGNTEIINIGEYTISIKYNSDFTDNTNPKR